MQLSTKSRQIQALLLICFSVLATYSNTFYASWHFDDRPGIVQNPHLHAQKLDVDALIHAIYSNPQDPLKIREKPYRPVANVSFALNWYLHQSDVLGFHIVNISIHIFTALVLFFTLLRLHNTPCLRGAPQPAFQIALLASLIWAVHPIQTQAVTYIVQRMAQLAAMFYIIGIYCYVAAREFKSVSSSVLWLFGALLAYGLAFGSKENASIFPLSLLLVELVFFQKLNTKRSKRLMAFSFILVGLITLGIIVLYTGEKLPSFLKLYSNRSFSIEERLLTEPRILFHYLGQIFFPLPSRFSIAHDVILSESIFFPWSTLTSIVGIVGLCLMAIVKIKAMPVLSFGVLFYFLNHIVESSIIPLELIFEHRNYLPTLFLFWPLAWVILKITEYYRQKSNVVYRLFQVAVVLCLIGLGSAAFIRNQAWESNDALWNDALIKAPNHARPYNILATDLTWGNKSTHPKRFDLALKLFEISLDKYSPRKTAKSGTYVNMASIYHNQKKDYKKAIELYEKGLEVDPESLISRYYIITPLMMTRQWDKALFHANFLLSRRNWDSRYHLAKGRALFWKGEYDKALNSFKTSLALEPNNPRLLLYYANILNRLSDSEKALPILNQALQGTSIDPIVRLALIETHTRLNNVEKAKENLEIIFSLYNNFHIEEWLQTINKAYLSVPVDLDIVSKTILEEISVRNALSIN